jgi:hypothetical protein
VWTCNLQKFFLGSCIHLLVQKFFLCIGITYLSLVLSNLFRSTLSSNCTLAFRLGQNLSNIPRFMLSKQKFPLILFYLSTKILPLSRSYLFFFRSGFFLSTELHKSSRILHTTTTDLRTKILFSFSSQQSQFQVPTTEPFVGTGADPGFNASTTHQQNPNYRPFRQHLRSRRSLTRGRGRGGYRTQVSVTKLGHRSVIITLHRVLRNNTH